MTQLTQSDEDTQQVLIGSVLILVILFIFVADCLLIWFATLRENQAFWTYAGGYPILLRDIVYVIFFPLLIGTAVSLLVVSMACFSKICASLRFFILETFMLLLCWVLLFAAGSIAFKNNVQNLLNGAPLHHHDKTPTRS